MINFIPPNGSTSWASVVHNGTQYIAFVIPYVEDGYFYVQVMSNNAQEGKRKRAQGGTLEFNTRPIRADYVGQVLSQFIPSDCELQWQSGQVQTRYDYPVMAYVNREQYVNEAVLGRVAQ